MTDKTPTPRTDARGVLATIHSDGYWTNKMPEQDPFPYLSHHTQIEVCDARELSEARAELEKVKAEHGTSPDWIKAGDGTLHGAIDYWHDRAERAEAALEEAMMDKERLDWAHTNPERTYYAIVERWNTAGRGFRESFFDWRAAIDQAIRDAK